MQGLKERIKQAQELLRLIQQRRQEVKAKAAQTQAARTNYRAEQRLETAGWNQSSTRNSGSDVLEETFQRWETQDELDRLKRNMGR